jgi:hypothetical protein
MDMRVIEAGHQGHVLAVYLSCVGAFELVGLLNAPHPEDFITPDRHKLGGGVHRLHSDDPRIAED